MKKTYNRPKAAFVRGPEEGTEGQEEKEKEEKAAILAAIESQ